MSKQQQQQRREVLSLRESIAAEASRLSELRRFERNAQFELSSLQQRLASMQQRIAEHHEAMAQLPAKKADVQKRLELLKKRYIVIALAPQIEKLRQLRSVLKEEES